MSPKPGGSPFLDVTPPGRRPPSWIAKHRAPAPDLRSLRPAPIPREFVDAVQAEVALNATKLDEGAALQRATRPPSEHPPKRTRAAAARGPAAHGSTAPGASAQQGFAAGAAPSSTSISSSTLAAVSGTTRAGGSSIPARRLPGESSSPFAAQLSPTAQLNEETRAALHGAIENLVHARTLIVQTAAAQLAELAATIARRVISHELSVNPAIVRRLVDEGLQALERDDRVLVRVGDGFAQEQTALLERFGTEGGNVEVVVDPTLSHFGCVVETEHGWVDESVESRLAALLQELRSDPAPA